MKNEGKKNGVRNTNSINTENLRIKGSSYLEVDNTRKGGIYAS